MKTRSKNEQLKFSQLSNKFKFTTRKGMIMLDIPPPN